MLLFPYNSGILDSMVLCLESFYRTLRARSFSVSLASIRSIGFIGEQENPHFQCMTKCSVSVNVVQNSP